MATYGGTDIFEKKENVTFREFTLRIAGITAEVRYALGDNLEARIPDEFKPDANEKKSVEEAKKTLEQVKTMTLEEAEKEARHSYDTSVKQYYDAINNCNSLRAKYVSMKEQVLEWKPPTKNHEGLKGLMLRQLDESIEHDCSLGHWTPPVRKTGAEYKTQRIQIAQQQLYFSTKSYEQAVEKAKRLTNWVQTLKKSLPEE